MPDPAPIERAELAILPLLTDEMNMPFDASDFGKVPVVGQFEKGSGYESGH